MRLSLALFSAALVQQPGAGVAGAASITTVATQGANSATVGGFSLPFMGSAGRVVYNGYSSNGGKTLLQWAGGKTATVVSTSTKIPGAASAAFAGYSDVSTSSAGTAFYGEGPASAKSTWGIYVAAPNDKKLTPVATLGSFVSMSNPSIDASGGVAFTAERAGEAGLWYAPSTGAAQSVVVDTEAFPTGPAGSVLKCIENPVVSGGVAVFFGSTCDDPQASMRNSDRMVRTRAACSSALHDVGSSNTGAGIFLVHLNTTDSGDNDDSRSHDHGSTRPVVEALATSRTAPPGMPEATFEAFSNPVVGREMVAFIATTSAGTRGVYAYTLSTKSLGVVADTTTAVPGAASGTNFSDFPTPPSVHDTSVAFYGAAPGTDGGIFVQTPTQGLAAVVTMADELDGQAPVYLGFGPDAFDGTNVAFYGVTTTDGIFTTTVPETHRS